MQIIAHTNGTIFNIPCGDGDQNFKWLGLVVSERYWDLNPHGRCRSREDTLSNIGFYLPSCIRRKQNNEILNPMDIIKEKCEDKENILIDLQTELKINEYGIPILSQWSISAYISSELYRNALGSTVCSNKETKTQNKIDKTSKILKDDDKDIKKQQGTQQQQDKKSMISEKFSMDKTKQTLIPDEKSTTMCVMLDKTLYKGADIKNITYEGNLTEIEKDWKNIDVSDFLDIKASTGNSSTFRNLYNDYYSYLVLIYNYYGMGYGQITGYNYLMSLLELYHFIYECSLFPNEDSEEIIEKISHKCIKFSTDIAEPKTFSNEINGSRSDNIRKSFKRSEFIECIFRCVIMNAKLYDKEDKIMIETIKDIFDKRVITTIKRLTSEGIKQILYSASALSIYQENKALLAQAYTSYSEKQRYSISPFLKGSLTIDELKIMLNESGILCLGNPNVHNAIISQALQLTFSGFKCSQDKEDPSISTPLNSVVFVEFIEIFCRIGIEVWKDECIHENDIIQIVVDTIKSLKYSTKFKKAK